jgi:DNA-binding CsgD family transcriptional regulator
VEHGLPIWEIHALVRLGNYDAMRDGTLDRLEQTRRQACAVGAVAAQYQAEASIALHTVLHGDFAAADTLITEVLAAATRLKLLDNAQYVLLARAVSYGHRGRRQDMDGTLAEFRRWGGDQTLHAPRVYGLARTFCALLEENRPRALVELSRALDAERTNPTFFGLSGRYGLHLLLSALSGDADLSTYRAITADPASGLRWDRQFALFARSVLAGRSGRAAEATEAVAEALHVGEPYAMGKHLGLRLVCEAALTDGWGTPIEWLRVAEDHFYNANVPAVASACRALLRRAGIRVPQRRTGAEDIPSPLRSAGLTVREYEVLRLLADRLANREIADRLHLSPRTVERHVSSLIIKTGLPNRIALGELVATMTLS